MSAASASTTLARLATDEATARRIVDVLLETADPETTALSASETAEGWLVEIHFRDPPDEQDIRRMIGTIAGNDAAATLTFAPLATVDWVRQSLEGLKPVDAGRFTIHGAHDRANIAPHRIGIEIEAALAFGTGHHGTTRGCLLALEAISKRMKPRRILDIGTGSGVLAIAAARALRQPVLASDIDILAVIAARENAKLNRAARFVETIHAPGLTARRFRERAPFDLVFANILLAPLLRLSHSGAQLIAPGGHIVLSGLLPSQAQAALSAYRTQGLRLERRIDLEDWTTLVLRRGIQKACA